jgi:hypothetical protein
VKKILTENLPTKLMAVVLAGLTWFYLFQQGVETQEIGVRFEPPTLDPEIFASARYTDAQGQELVPGDSLRVNLSGPKADIRFHVNRPQNMLACRFTIEPGDLEERERTLSITLKREDFGVQNPNITVQPLPSSTLKLKYVRFDEKTVDLVLPDPPSGGRLRDGYQLESVNLLQQKIRVKLPADRASPERVLVKRLSVEDKWQSFIESGELDPLSQMQGIRPKDAFQIEVKIVPTPTRKSLTLDLVLATKAEHFKRLQLQVTSIEVEVLGPDALVSRVTHAALQAYAVVTDQDMPPPSDKEQNISIKEHGIGCHVLDPEFRGKLQIVVMPKAAPENRTVPVKVLPK